MVHVAYFVHGRGRGHASRASTVVPALRAAGHRVSLFAGGTAFEVLSARQVVRRVDSVLPGAGAPLRLLCRIPADRRELRRLGAEVVVSDGDAPSLHAATTLGLHTIAVSHGLVFTDTRLPPGLDPRALAIERANVEIASAGARVRIAVHFLPAEPISARSRVARPDRRPDLPATVGDDGFVLAYFRDANGWAAASLVARHRPVVVFGTPPPGPLPTGVKVLPHSSTSFAEHLTRCHAVVGSSGSNLLAEAVELGKPVLATYRQDDREQSFNAQLIEKAGLGQSTPLDAIDATTVDSFLVRSGRGEFRTLDLSACLSAVSEVVVDAVSSPK